MGQKKAQSIGIFDSGIGGFSILKQIHELAPELNVHYIADSSFAPYGNKSKSEIIERSIFITNELLKFDLDLIVVACNTATGVAIDHLRERFDIPFVGVEPFINALSKHEWQNGDKGCVITTELMSKSERFNNLITRLDPLRRLSYVVTPELASTIEEFFLGKDESLLKKKLRDQLSFVRENSYTHLILGCTHYPLIGKYIEEASGAKTLSPCLHVASRTLSVLEREEGLELLVNPQFQFAETQPQQSLRFVSKDFSSLP
ncbi:glutamate racemase [Halobacteriovorax sp. JY17]|uniref:glutamate racemase n=1 Tax=Halobacteriovorax sp. JY17 TaxID=2014617 RepID=UPI000C3D0116|nr:glutamate racemase [Halobacteriovorax sp. JY17]PIK15637.1 MAG: glutamate racemase [Halobacteriovorax sp. JY17]